MNTLVVLILLNLACFLCGIGVGIAVSALLVIRASERAMKDR